MNIKIFSCDIFSRAEMSYMIEGGIIYIYHYKFKTKSKTVLASSEK